MNTVEYGKLLARVLPRVIETPEENEAMIAQLEKLDRQGSLIPEQQKLADLMTVLIQRFEENNYPIGQAKPIEALRFLMEQRELRQRDLIPVFGSSSVVSDVLNEKRSISKAHARKLSEFFNVSVSLFI